MGVDFLIVGGRDVRADLVVDAVVRAANLLDREPVMRCRPGITAFAARAGITNTCAKRRACASPAIPAPEPNASGHHATKHFDGTGHPVVRSVEPDGSWRWCYLDELLG
ncbi:hypothetical protein ACQPZ2_20610 [Nocardia pseudovaccinii]|uniref:hypothetical protein n=1 Tax=Nocardia pseudovaccinii TaxID=189540 RepID=UPI003D8D8D9F